MKLGNENGYPSVLTESNCINADTVAVTKDVPIFLGSYTVQAGEAISLGIGKYESYEAANGRIYSKFQNATPAEVKGVFRISIWSAQNKPMKILKEFHTSQLNTNVEDLTKQMPLSEQYELLTEDKKLVFEFIPEADETIVKANTVMYIPITKYEVL